MQAFKVEPPIGRGTKADLPSVVKGRRPEPCSVGLQKWARNVRYGLT
jgi:hypothetical protein